MDVLGLSETKIDASFPDAQFHVDDFRLYRKDRNRFGGGLMIYVTDNIPQRRRVDLEIESVKDVEHIVLELKFKTEKVFLILVYRPPDTHVSSLENLLTIIIDKCLLQCKTVFVMGDMNVDCKSSNHLLSDFFDAFDLKNVIKGPTCFKSAINPSLVDVILTNSPCRVLSHLNVNIDLSDFHNIICVATRIHAPKSENRTICYRSYKRMNDECFIKDLSCAPLHVGKVFDDVDDQAWFFNTLVRDIVDQHAPEKRKKVTCNPLPYMNSELRKAINVKAMLRRKYNRSKTNASWNKYRLQRNRVANLKRKSMNKYFKLKCENVKISNGREFWKCISPFFSNKANNSNNISLNVDGNMLCNRNDVCNAFNDFFINVPGSSELCTTVDDAISMYENNASVQSIRNSRDQGSSFSFHLVTSDQVELKLKNLKSNKAPGHDQIPAKLLKKGATVLSAPLADIVNACIDESVFPQDYKHAEVRPIYKKNDPLNMNNYRPVSVLTGLSKVVEGIICDQMMDYLSNILSSSLSAYRKKYSCVNVLLKCSEEWKKALDENKVIGCVLMDLSKAFDMIPHDLLVAKLYAYGFSLNACELIKNYLSNRLQRVKLENDRSEWMTLKCGVPQGSLTGPVLFNIFINDLLHVLDECCDVYNYADDNTLSFSHDDPCIVKSTLERSAKKALEWFANNNMKANPEKFQAMVLGRNGKGSDIVFNLPNNVVIQPGEHVKLLGVHLDNNLNFSYHISELTKKCARQVNALARISQDLTKECKLLILNSFVLSNLDYGSVIYHYCKLSDAKQLELLQKRCLRYVLNDFHSSYKEMLSQQGQPTLHTRRLRLLIECVHRVLNDECLPMPSSFFTMKEQHYQLRNVKTIEIRRSNTITYGNNSLRYHGAGLWNNIPNNLKDANMNEIKCYLKNWALNCTCRNCPSCSIDVM